MTNQQKRILCSMCKQGWSFDDIKNGIDCADSTIKKYMKQFSPKTKKKHVCVHSAKRGEK